MRDRRLRIVVGGFLGLLPAGGVTWDYLQYPVGLAALGHDVYYIEDTGLWPVYQTGSERNVDCTANVSRLAAVMNAFGLGDRWAYRDEISGAWLGLTEATVRELCRSADVLINVSCATVMRETYRAIPVRALIDSDPMFTQIQAATQQSFTHGVPAMAQLLRDHTHHFSFGENIGGSDCRIPTLGLSWRPTRQPVCLSHWPVRPLPTAPDAAYTTVMNWAAGPPLLFESETWGQKDIEFRRFLQLPAGVAGARLAVAVARNLGALFPAAAAERFGWRVLDPARCASDWRTYRRFIRQSRGEFSVAKETYIKARTGWFSGRSACYLASGRPVIAQDTGWSDSLPTGCGLLAFSDEQSARESINRVIADPERHARAARAIAEEYFDSDRVLSRLLSDLESPS